MSYLVLVSPRGYLVLGRPRRLLLVMGIRLFGTILSFGYAPFDSCRRGWLRRVSPAYGGSFPRGRLLSYIGRILVSGLGPRRRSGVFSQAVRDGLLCHRERGLQLFE